MVVYGKNGIIGYIVNSHENYSQVVPIHLTKSMSPSKLMEILDF